jgi:hypothetical protein
MAPRLLPRPTTIIIGGEGAKDRHERIPPALVPLRWQPLSRSCWLARLRMSRLLWSAIKRSCRWSINRAQLVGLNNPGREARLYRSTSTIGLNSLPPFGSFRHGHSMQFQSCARAAAVIAAAALLPIAPAVADHPGPSAGGSGPSGGVQVSGAETLSRGRFAVQLTQSSPSQGTEVTPSSRSSLARMFMLMPEILASAQR